MRDKLVSILASLDTPSLIKALQANGINVDMPQGGALDGMGCGDGSDEKIQSWNDRPIKMKGTGAERPSLTDKSWLQTEESDPSAAVDDFMGGGDTDLTPFMPQGEGGEV